MEKSMRSKKSNFLTFLAKSTSFSNPAPPMKHAQYHNKGFSGPILHLIPDEARRKQKTDIPFETQEPTSPTVSCIGQIKQKAKKNKLPRAKSIKKHAPPKPEKKPRSSSNHDSFVQRMFGQKPPSSRRKLQVSRSDNLLASTSNIAPRIDHMKRFKSGRESLRDFDWREVEREIKGMDSKEDDMSVYYSAPLVLGGGVVAAPEPRKEVNIWKRRTIGPPVPLKLDEL